MSLRAVGPKRVVLWQVGRSAVRSGLGWGVVFGFYVAASALGYAATYPTAKERHQLAASFGSNVGFGAIIGPARHIDTVSGFTAWRTLGVLSIVGGIWGALLATKRLRGEEEAGRWEVLLAGQTTRRDAVVQGIGAIALGVLTAFGITVLVGVLVGQSPKVGFSPGAAVFLALALVASPCLFAAVGVLTSQLAATRRQAAAYANAFLGIAYALRMSADSGVGLDGLRWASPLGWVEELRPLGATRPIALLPIAALSALALGAAVYLAGARDLGSSTIPDRSSAPPRNALLFGPTGLAVRLVRPTFVGWAIGICAGGLVMGVIAKSVGDALNENATARKALERLGGRGGGAGAYLAVVFILVTLVISLVAAGQAAAIRNEEADGRLDNVLVRSVSRVRWLCGRLLITTVFLIGAGLVAGAAAWAGAASQDAGLGLTTLLQAGLNLVPPSVLVLGLGTLAIGVLPRTVSVATYGVLAWSFLVEIIGGVVKANHWLLDTSVLHHTSAMPVASANWGTDAVLVALGVAAALVGAAAFRRRDLVSA